MENAVNALKIVFAIVVFGIALTILFHMTSLARSTSDQVITAIDKTTYIDYSVDTNDENSTGARIVKFSDIIPVIYRYSKEGYGVTIIQNNKIVARFDLETESAINNCIWDSDVLAFATTSRKETSKNYKSQLRTYLNTYILEKVGATNLKDENDLNDLCRNLYYQGTSANRLWKNTIAAPWIGSDKNIVQRIDCDLAGGKTYFSLTNYGSNELVASNQSGAHVAVINNGGEGLSGDGLLETYSGKKFKEYIIEIDSNSYIKDENGEETNLLTFGTIRYSKKREIIYVYYG